MAAVTFDVARVPAAATAPQAGVRSAAPRKPWYVRLFNALIEARMEQARREIRMHTQLMPYEFDAQGHRVVKTDAGNMPVGGW